MSKQVRERHDSDAQDGEKPEVGFLFTQEDIEEFKALMREECDVELTNREAWDRATDLVGLFRMLAGPIPEDPERNGPDSGVRTLSNLP